MVGASSMRRGGWGAFAVTQACVLVFTAAVAYVAMFSTFRLYDDEGFMMMTVRHLLDGHRLYDEIWTLYGPVYYFYKWMLHGPLGLPLTHDVVRLNAAGVWLATALVSAGIVFAMTRSLVLAVLAQVVVVFHLRTLTYEPGHPQEMAALLVAGVVAMALVADHGERRLGTVGLGVLVGLLAMVKVNLGVLAGVAVWMAISSALLMRGSGAVLRVASAVAAVALPLLLTRGEAAARWTPFLGTETASVLAVAMLSLALPGKDGRLAGLVTFAAACGAGVALALLFPLMRETSWAGLVECLIIGPGRLAGVFGFPPYLLPSAPTIAAVSLALAAAGAWLGPTWLQDGLGGAAVAIAKLAFAAYAVWASWKSNGPLLLSCITPFLWVVLLPGPGGGARDAGWLARLVLVWVAVLLPLQVYPVAGSQIPCGTFLHPLCAAVAVADVRTWLWRLLPWAARPAPRAVGAAVMLAVLALFGWERLSALRIQYARFTPLGLPGTERLRVAPRQARMLQSLADYLRTNAETFLVYPGFNSLYFWTGKVPPTVDVLSHGDIRHYPEKRQAAMVAALLRYPKAYVVLSPPWGGRIYPPFMARIDASFERRLRISVYDLLARRPPRVSGASNDVVPTPRRPGILRQSAERSGPASGVSRAVLETWM